MAGVIFAYKSLWKFPNDANVLIFMEYFTFLELRQMQWRWLRTLCVRAQGFPYLGDWCGSPHTPLPQKLACPPNIFSQKCCFCNFYGVFGHFALNAPTSPPLMGNPVVHMCVHFMPFIISLEMGGGGGRWNAHLNWPNWF